MVPSDLYNYTDQKRLNYSISLNGEKVDAEINPQGYVQINRKWKKGDQVQIHFDMEPRTVKANENVVADKGRISVERGPLVYCAEFPDNEGFDIRSILVNQLPRFSVQDKNIDVKTDTKDASYGVKALVTKAQALSFGKNGTLETKDVDLTLIPYYAWNHRGPGNMMVWLPQDVNATTPTRQK